MTSCPSTCPSTCQDTCPTPLHRAQVRSRRPSSTWPRSPRPSTGSLTSPLRSPAGAKPTTGTCCGGVAMTVMMAVVCRCCGGVAMTVMMAVMMPLLWWCGDDSDDGGDDAVHPPVLPQDDVVSAFRRATSRPAPPVLLDADAPPDRPGPAQPVGASPRPRRSRRAACVYNGASAMGPATHGMPATTHPRCHCVFFAFRVLKQLRRLQSAATAATTTSGGDWRQVMTGTPFPARRHANL